MLCRFQSSAPPPVETRGSFRTDFSGSRIDSNIHLWPCVEAGSGMDLFVFFKCTGPENKPESIKMDIAGLILPCLVLYTAINDYTQ